MRKMHAFRMRGTSIEIDEKLILALESLGLTKHHVMNYYLEALLLGPLPIERESC